MFKKLYLILLFFIFCFPNTTFSKEKNDKNLLAFSGGLWDWNDDNTAGLLNIEYRHGTRYGPFKPIVGGLINTDHGFYGYLGVRIDLYLTNNIVIAPSFAPGLYEKGDGKDLGHIIEFRSGLDLSYRRNNGSNPVDDTYFIDIIIKRYISN